MDITKIAPSLDLKIDLHVVTETDAANATALAVLVTEGEGAPAELGTNKESLKRLGFEPKVGQTLGFVNGDQQVKVAVGAGPVKELTAAELRKAAAAFVRSVSTETSVAFPIPTLDSVDAKDAAAAVVEGMILGRYQYSLACKEPEAAPLAKITLITAPGNEDAVSKGASRGFVTARAASLARDLAIAPPAYLTPTALGEVAKKVATTSNLEVEVHDKASITEMGLGGLLGVNRGSAEEPRLIIMRYRSEGATGHLALVGKGITYDSGGISLKPANLSHAQMKTDMTGAGDILAAMTALDDLGVTSAVTAYLVSTDNMPSGSAMQLGDVLTIRGGKTVEVLNTDAEGRLVLADGLSLANEDKPDAIIDIATLTGLAMRTFGEDIAALMSNSPNLTKQVEEAGKKADEPVWELPLLDSYKSQLKSSIADLKNIGGENAGTITAGLFLQEFIGNTPWVHLDIAGPSWASKTQHWINSGPTAFGTRLLIEVADAFVAPHNNR